MPKVTEAQVGRVFLKEVAPGKWRASWVDPLTKKHIRRVLPASSFQAARKEADAINTELAAGRGFGGRLRGTTGHAVADAVDEAVKHTAASEYTRKCYLWAYNAFADYLTEKVAGVQAWGEVNEAVLEDYLEDCRRAGVAYDTIRQRLFVLRLTASYMARTYQYRDVAAGVKLRNHTPTKAEIEAKDAVLSPCQLAGLLAWLRQHEPMLYVWATMQGLAGARLLEVVYLREQDFDPAAQTVTITKNEAHTPKNKSSFRTIPVAPAVATALSEWIAGLKVRHPLGFLFTPSRGGAKRGAGTIETRVGALSNGHASHLLTEAIRVARRDGVDLPEQFIGRKLRATFVTHVRRARADFEMLQAYIGHTPTSILSRHYDDVDLERLRPMAALGQQLFELSGSFQGPAGQEAKNSAVLH